MNNVHRSKDSHFVLNEMPKICDEVNDHKKNNPGPYRLSAPFISAVSIDPFTNKSKKTNPKRDANQNIYRRD